MEPLEKGKIAWVGFLIFKSLNVKLISFEMKCNWIKKVNTRSFFIIEDGPGPEDKQTALLTLDTVFLVSSLL